MKGWERGAPTRLGLVTARVRRARPAPEAEAEVVVAEAAEPLPGVAGVVAEAAVAVAAEPHGRRAEART